MKSCGGMRRALALVIAAAMLNLCGCAASSVDIEVVDLNRDSIVSSMMDAIKTGRESVRVHVPMRLAEQLDSGELDGLFATAHYNDAVDLPIYPASRTCTYASSRSGGYTATFSLDFGDISAADYSSSRGEYLRMLDEYAVELGRLNEEPAKLYRTIYFLVCQHSQYDYTLSERIAAGEQSIFEAASLKERGAYGAMVQRSSICTGYAMLYKALCDKMGLDCWVVFGEADGVIHAWNLIIIDGKIRYVDTANGDRDSGGEPNADFCIIAPIRFNTLERVTDEEIYIPQKFYDAGYRSQTPRR